MPCAHDHWTPVPLEAGVYTCTHCGALGWRSRGAIRVHKRPDEWRRSRRLDVALEHFRTRDATDLAVQRARSGEDYEGTVEE